MILGNSYAHYTLSERIVRMNPFAAVLAVFLLNALELRCVTGKQHFTLLRTCFNLVFYLLGIPRWQIQIFT